MLSSRVASASRTIVQQSCSYTRGMPQTNFPVEHLQTKVRALRGMTDAGKKCYAGQPSSILSQHIEALKMEGQMKADSQMKFNPYMTKQ